MTTTTKPKIKQDHSKDIETTIARFNFERVHCVLNALDIKWIYKDKEICKVPTIADLKAGARSILQKSINSKPHSIGGLIGSSRKNKDSTYSFSLAFIVTASTNDKRQVINQL